ncbi:MAG: hypothetical protein ACIAXF_03050 [Phycisphaerales bacterium JB063]
MKLLDATRDRLLPHLDRLEIVFQHHLFASQASAGVPREQWHETPISETDLAAVMARTDNIHALVLDIEGGWPLNNGPWGADDWVTPELAEAGRRAYAQLARDIRCAGYTGRISGYNIGSLHLSHNDASSQLDAVIEHSIRMVEAVNDDEPVGPVDVCDFLCPAFYPYGVSAESPEAWASHMGQKLDFMERWNKTVIPLITPAMPDGTLCPWLDEQVAYLTSRAPLVEAIGVWAGPGVPTAQPADWLSIGVSD